MRIISVDLKQRPFFSSEEATVIRQTIMNGSLIVCPTESSYLIGGNALDERAVKAVFTVKGRSDHKPLPLIVESLEQAEQMAIFEPIACHLAESFWPGPLTIVLPARNNLPRALIGGRSTIGMRISAFPLIQELCSLIHVPLISTSANLSGGSEPYYPHELMEAITCNQVSNVELFIDAGALEPRKASTVIEISCGTLIVHRQGPIPVENIELIIDLYSIDHEIADPSIN